MDSCTPASVQGQQPEVYVDYPEIHQYSQNHPAVSIQENSHMELSRDAGMEVVKQEPSDGLCDDGSHRFDGMGDMADGSITEEITGPSHSESKFKASTKFSQKQGIE